MVTTSPRRAKTFTIPSACSIRLQKCVLEAIGSKPEDIYNPFSLLNTFAKMRFGSYWFETGTPTFLVELLKHSRYDLHRLTEEMASADSLGGIDTMNTNPVPILRPRISSLLLRIPQ